MEYYVTSYERYRVLSKVEAEDEIDAQHQIESGGGEEISSSLEGINVSDVLPST